MGIDREHFSNKQYLQDLPHWKCPTCKKGVLQIVPDSLAKAETVKSLLKRERANWKEWHLQYKAHLFLKCSRNECNEVVSITGAIEYEKNKSKGVREIFYPLMVLPPIHFFQIPYYTPYNCESEILKAFTFFWVDPSTCANKIRNAVEYILNDQKVKIYGIKKNGGRKKMDLHHRIEHFQTKKKDAADTLMAIKWIGNAGSHLNELEHEDILIGFELLEHALNELYGEEEPISVTRNRILKRKKPDSL